MSKKFILPGPGEIKDACDEFHVYRAVLDLLDFIHYPQKNFLKVEGLITHEYGKYIVEKYSEYIPRWAVELVKKYSLTL